MSGYTDRPGRALQGFVGFDSVRSRKAWPDEDVRILRMLAELVGAALDRRRQMLALRDSERRFRGLLEDLGQAAVTRAGDRRRMVWNDTVLRDSAGTVVGRASLGEDVTARRQAEEQLALQESLLDMADPSEFQQLIVNRCVNARDAVVEAGGVGAISVRTRSVEGSALRARVPEAGGGAYVEVTVADDGIGMTPQVRRRVFEPFFTTPGGRRGRAARARPGGPRREGLPRPGRGGRRGGAPGVRPGAVRVQVGDLLATVRQVLDAS